MKKKYEKPVLELVEFEVSSAIATCSDDVTNGATGIKCVKEEYEGYHLFSEGETGCEPVNEYCYYPSDFSLINS